MRGRLAAVEGAPGAPAGGRVGLDPGPLAVCLVIAGLPVRDLGPGATLRVGDAVVVELTGAPPGGPGGLREPDGAEVVGAHVLAGGCVGEGDPVLLEAVRVPIEDALDLHPFRPAEIPAVVREYLAGAAAAGLRVVRLIHGRGRGVQRAAVRRVLADSSLVAAFEDAPPEQGGWGATLVRLRAPGGSCD